MNYVNEIAEVISNDKIAKNIYSNNKELYDGISIKEKSFLKQYKNLEDAKVAKIQA